MAMKIYQPREELRPYVRYYWVLESDEPFSVLTFPIGCPQMIFHRRTPLFIPELSCRQDKFTISGQVNFPAHIASDGDMEMIVAVFYPHTIGMFIDTPPSAFYNQEISGYDIGNKHLNLLADWIFDCADPETAISVIEQWLTAQIRPSLNIERIGESIAALLRSPSTSVDTLAGISCLGKKQYGRLFREYVGIRTYSAVSASIEDVAARLKRLCRHHIRQRILRPVAFHPRLPPFQRHDTQTTY